MHSALWELEKCFGKIPAIIQSFTNNCMFFFSIKSKMVEDAVVVEWFFYILVCSVQNIRIIKSISVLTHCEDYI